MKTMTRILAAVMLLCMALTLCACGEADPTKAPTNAPTNKPTSAPTQPTPAPTQTPTQPDDGQVEYRVTVLYPDGTPVVGKSVQVCHESAGCSFPTPTDANGVAVVRFQDLSGCGAKVMSKIEGYQKMEDYIYFEEGSRELTITLVPEEAAA